MTAVMLANHRRVAPFGVAGGEPAATGRNWIERASGSSRALRRDVLDAPVRARRRDRDRNARRRRIRQGMSERNPACRAWRSRASRAPRSSTTTSRSTTRSPRWCSTSCSSRPSIRCRARCWRSPPSAVGYLSRPFGGILFGHLGDRHGRRFVLVMTLLMMGITTTLIGLLPTYAAGRRARAHPAGDAALRAGHGARR